MESSKPISRRTVAKGAAWSVPVIAVAAAAPATAASPPGPAPNGSANYYWSGVPGPDGGRQYVTLTPATGGNEAHFSAQISYQADPWVPPPASPTLIVTIVFDPAVTVSNLQGGWTVNPVTGSFTTFVFTKSLGAKEGGPLNFDVVTDDPGDLTARATLTMKNNQREDGSYATWTDEAGIAETEVVS